MTEPERILYLAIPVEIFTSFFQERFVQEAVSVYQIRLLVYDPESERIIEWKD